MQSELESFVEVCLNVAIGFIISALMWPLVCWWLQIPYSHSDNLTVTAFFTVLSITRGYIVRRFFNAQLHNTSINIAHSLKGVKA